MASRTSWRSATIAALIAALVMSAIPVVAAVGDPILAGRLTSANSMTRLEGDVATFTLKITNTHADGSAVKFVVEPGNPPFAVNSKTKVVNLNADKVDGVSVGGLMKKNVYDTNRDGVVDSAQVAVRYATNHTTVDYADAFPNGRVTCITDSLTLAESTMVVATGGISMDPYVTSTSPIWSYAVYSADGVNWSTIGGVAVEAVAADGEGDATMPVNSIRELAAGTYTFGISPSGGADLQDGDDYDCYCELTITAFTGLGSAVDGIAGAPSAADTPIDH